MNDREVATVLAALRVYQRTLNMNGGMPPRDVEDIATNDGQCTSMDDGEIDDLCERINCGEVA